MRCSGAVLARGRAPRHKRMSDRGRWGRDAAVCVARTRPREGAPATQGARRRAAGSRPPRRVRTRCRVGCWRSAGPPALRLHGRRRRNPKPAGAEDDPRTDWRRALANALAYPCVGAGQACAWRLGFRRCGVSTANATEPRSFAWRFPPAEGGPLPPAAIPHAVIPLVVSRCSAVSDASSAVRSRCRIHPPPSQT